MAQQSSRYLHRPGRHKLRERKQIRLVYYPRKSKCREELPNEKRRAQPGAGRLYIVTFCSVRLYNVFLCLSYMRGQRSTNAKKGLKIMLCMQDNGMKQIRKRLAYVKKAVQTTKSEA